MPPAQQLHPVPAARATGVPELPCRARYGEVAPRATPRIWRPLSAPPPVVKTRKDLDGRTFGNHYSELRWTPPTPTTSGTHWRDYRQHFEGVDDGVRRSYDTTDAANSHIGHAAGSGEFGRLLARGHKLAYGHRQHGLPQKWAGEFGGPFTRVRRPHVATVGSNHQCK